VPAITWSHLRHDDQMAEPGRDILVAARTEVRLAGLIGLDPLHADRLFDHPNKAQASSTTQAITAAATIT
jgi:hypothetical protein